MSSYLNGIDLNVVTRAFAGADSVFWLVPPDPHAKSVEAAYADFSRPACEAFKRQGVKRVVGVSALGRGTPWVAHAGLVTASLAMDDLIASTGVSYRALTNPSFMDNLLRQVESIKKEGLFSLPISGDLKQPSCATRDIAAVGARLLLDHSWSGVASRPVLGPEDLSYHDMAQIMSEVLGKPVRFQQITGEAFKARLLQRGMSEAMAQGQPRHVGRLQPGARHRRAAHTRVHHPHQLPPVVRGSAASSRPGLSTTATENEHETIERKQCMEIAGKVVLITGASSGIGLVTARLFAQKGAKLALAARSAEKLAQLASELPDALALPTDLRDEAEVRRMVTQTREHYQRIDVLINNAAQGQFAPIENMNLGIYRTIFEVNVVSVIAAMQEVIPIMRAQGGGVIINISSGASKIPPERYRTNPVAPYASTKYALNAITLIGRQQLAADNISLGLVYPGVTATNFFNTLLEGRQPTSAPGGATDVASPESVAETILEAVETQAAEVYTENLKQALSESTLRA